MAIYLSGKGYKVDIFERRPDMRKEKVSGGRSINLALSARGIHSLEEVGLYDDIKKISIPMYGRMVHLVSGENYFQRYGKDDSEYINAVSRAELNKSLINLAEKNKNINFYFNYKCDGFNFIDGELRLFNEDTKEHSWLERNRIIAADGAFSAVRNEMLKHTRFNYNQEFENYGYKELTIPPGKGNTFLLEKNALHIWPRGSFMLIALPNLDGSFTCTLFLAHEFSMGGSNSFEFLRDENKVEEFLSRNFPDAFSLIPDPASEFLQNPTGNLVTVKCFPWSFEDKVVLLGDSAHAIVPFFGQGMNAAFEDCSCLNDLIINRKDDWENVFYEFQKQRKANTDAIADLAKENFIEMRDLVATPRFQLKKKIEAELYKKYSKKFIPKYSLVTFMRIPYSEAMKKGKVQDEILEKLTENISTIDQVDWNLAKILIKENL